MYTLNLKQTQHTSGGMFGMTPTEMKWLTTMAFTAAPNIFLPLALSAIKINEKSATARSITNAFSILATAGSFIAGKNLFEEPQSSTTVVYHLYNQTFVV